MERFDIFGQQVAGSLIGLGDDPAYLAVDFDSCLFGVILMERDIATEKDLLFFAAKGDRSEVFAHAPFADHLARKFRGFFDIVACACGNVAEDDLLGSLSS